MINTGNSRNTSRRLTRPRGGAVGVGVAKRKPKTYKGGKAGSAGNAYPLGYTYGGRLWHTRNFRRIFL